jgi:hypothetical protein
LPTNAYADSGDDVACADPGCRPGFLARADAYRQAAADRDTLAAADRDAHTDAYTDADRDTYASSAEANAKPHAYRLSASPHADADTEPSPTHKDCLSYGDGRTTYSHTDERLSLSAGSTGMA